MCVRIYGVCIRVCVFRWTDCRKHSTTDREEQTGLTQTQTRTRNTQSNVETFNRCALSQPLFKTYIQTYIYIRLTLFICVLLNVHSKMWWIKIEDYCCMVDMWKMFGFIFISCQLSCTWERWSKFLFQFYK